MTRHHDHPIINILLTRNLPIDSSVRRWHHPLMIPLHCLWAKSNDGTRGQFQCDVTWFCFCFDFVRSQSHCLVYYILLERVVCVCVCVCVCMCVCVCKCVCVCVCVCMWGVLHLNLDVQGQRGGRVLDAEGQGVGGL